MTNIAKPTEAIKPWPFFGYAPGHYSLTCYRCGETHLDWAAAKGAISCLECAIVAAKEHIETLRSSAPQEPDDATCADCGKPYSEHRRALAADIVWCPGDAIRTYVAQEPVVDDDAVHDFLREIYRRAHDEGAEDTIEQCTAEGREPPSKPHKDCKNEGAYQFIEDVKPKLIALFNRLQSKAPETD